MTDKRSKLILGLFLVSAVVVLALSLYTGISLNSVVDSLEQNRNQRLLAEAQATSLIVSADELDAIQDSSDLAGEEAEALERRLSAFAALHSLTDISFIRQLPSGELQYITCSDAGEGVFDISADTFASNDMISKALGGSIVVTDISEEAFDNAFMAYSPVYDSNGDVVAVAAVGIDDSTVLEASSMIRNLTVMLLVCIAIVILAASANVLLQLRKEQELQDSVYVQKLMIEISQNLASEQPFNTRVEETLETVGGYLGASRAFIVNISEAETRNSLRQHWSLDGEAPDLESEDAQGLWKAMRRTFTDEAVDAHAMVCIPDSAKSTYEEIAQLKTPMRACIWAPLVVQNTIWGVLALDFSKPQTEFPKKDIQLAESARSDLVGAITRELYSEQREQALDHAVQASEAKSEFLSNMSHEMRTPMNAIVGMTSIALGSNDPERKDYCLEHIKDASAHLLTIINDVLDMSSLQSNGLTLRTSSFDIHEMLDGVVKDHAHKITAQKQDFTLEIDGRIPSALIGDNQRLAKVVGNLLSNAIKFTPEGGAITIRVLSLGVTEEGHQLRFEIEDNGIGVDPALRNNLFGSFEQADSGSSRKYGGTGLGLAISRRLVELMHGQIGVQSEVNKGSLFFFTVTLQEAALQPERQTDYSAIEHKAIAPAATAATETSIDTAPSKKAEALGADSENTQQADATEISNSGIFNIIKDVDEAPDTPDLSRYRILLAEDIDINREVVLALLADSGVKIDVATNGIEVLDAIQEDPGGFDLIFMDLQMPEMDGLDATRRIRALPNPELEGLPIIAMTANVFQEDIDACLDAGMNDHIGKPISLEAIYRILDVYLPR